jgi:hypothetical protein
MYINPHYNIYYKISLDVTLTLKCILRSDAKIEKHENFLNVSHHPYL